MALPSFFVVLFYREKWRSARVELAVRYVCTGHCTRERAYSVMETVLGDRLHQLKCGLEMTF